MSKYIITWELSYAQSLTIFQSGILFLRYTKTGCPGHIRPPVFSNLTVLISHLVIPMWVKRLDIYGRTSGLSQELCGIHPYYQGLNISAM